MRGLPTPQPYGATTLPENWLVGCELRKKLYFKHDAILRATDHSAISGVQ